MLKKTFAALALGTALLSAGQAMAAEYKIDKEGQHAFVDWKISHLGYSFIHGTFKDFDGNFSWDSAKPEASKISVDLKTASLWSNHAERDKHIASADFLDVKKYPDAKFVSTSVKSTGDKTADVTGDLTMHGVTKPVTFKATFNGEGKDPWGGEIGRASILSCVIVKNRRAIACAWRPERLAMWQRPGSRRTGGAFLVLEPDDLGRCRLRLWVTADRGIVALRKGFQVGLDHFELCVAQATQLKLSWHLVAQSHRGPGRFQCQAKPVDQALVKLRSDCG